MFGDIPAKKAQHFWPSAKRLMGLLKPERAGIIAVLAMVTVAVVLNVVAPRILGQAMDVIFGGVIGKQLPAGGTKEQFVEGLRAQGQDNFADMLAKDGRHPGRRHRLPGARVPDQRGAGDVLRRQHLPVAAGLRPEHPGHAGGPPAARRHREEAQPASAELFRHPPARRHPLAGHQRRGQHPAGAAAGLRAAGELGADGDRHRHHDVHRVLAAGADCPGRAAALGRRRRHHRLPQPEALRRPVEEHRRAQRPDRGVLLRPRPRPGLRPRRRHAGPLRRAERGPLQGQLRRAVRLRHDHAGHAVRVLPQLRGNRRRRRSPRRFRRDEPGRRHRVHPVLARVHPAAGPDGGHGQHAAVRRRLRGAGL